MPKRLLIIQPSYYKSRTDRTIARAGRREVVPLVLAYLAALTPRDWEVRLADEMIKPVDFEAPVDLVAITTATLNSHRAYDLAAEFRRRGKPVILGGPHVFFFPEEAAQHADAVGVGEGELIWQQSSKRKLSRSARSWAPQKGSPAPGRPKRRIPKSCGFVVSPKRNMDSCPVCTVPPISH